MSDPRELVEAVIRNAMERWVEGPGHYYAAGFYANDADNATEAVYDALTAAGLLVEPGSETRVELEVMSRGYEWGERHEDGSVTKTALSGLVDDGWRPLRRDPATTVVRRTKTVYATEYGPWQPAEAINGEQT